MDQQEIKVSFSIATKLILSVVFLLIIVIAFLNLSSIVLFRDDKKAYTYQTQLMQAQLVGKDVVGSATHAFDVLRVVLSYLDQELDLSESQKRSIQGVIDNQSDIPIAQVLSVNRDSGDFRVLTYALKEKLVKAAGIDPTQTKITREWMKNVLPDLLSNGYGFINLSKPGMPPLLGVLFADRAFKSKTKDMPVAFALISLKGLAEGSKQTQLSVATRTGWVLFDTNPDVLYANASLATHPLFRMGALSTLSSGTQEYDHQDDHYLGSYYLPGYDLVVLTSTEWQYAMRATYLLIEKFALLGAMAVGAAIMFAIVFSKSLTAPITRLFDATKEVARGNFQLRVDSSGRDEISALSGSFNAMSQRIAELIQESIAKAHLDNELAIAATVQKTLIPNNSFTNSSIDVQSHYQSASQCGGDWWGFFTHEKKVVLMIADATGHGFPSALITASARSCFSVMQMLAQQDPEFKLSPSEMLAYANRVVYDSANGQIMMTFFISVIDLEASTMTYACAGHNPPWLFKKEGSGFALNSLTVVGCRLGEGKEAAPFEEKTVPVAAGDLLFLYTDGLTEGKDTSGEMYGKKRVRKTVEAMLSSGPRAIVDHVIREFLKHNGAKELDDDVTVAVAKILDVGTKG